MEKINYEYTTMYIHSVSILPRKEKKENKNNFFLQEPVITFPEGYIKFFVSDVSPKQITKEHQLIYTNHSIHVQSFKEPVLIQNFEKIRAFFNPLSVEGSISNLLYYCPDFESVQHIFKQFQNVLNIIPKYNSVKGEDSVDKKPTLYTTLLELFHRCEIRVEAHTRLARIEPHYNPYHSLFTEFMKSKEYNILSIIHERDEWFITGITRLTYLMNPLWQSDFNTFKEGVILENEKKLELKEEYEFCSILDSAEEQQTVDFSQTEEQLFSHLVVIIGEKHSSRKIIEYDIEKIKLMEKGYFSEFSILNEFIIPKEDSKFMKKLEAGLKGVENPDRIEQILIKFNEDLEEGTGRISISDKKHLDDCKRKRLLNDFLDKYARKKDDCKTSIAILFNRFIHFLRLYYPGSDNYFHNRNFTPLLKEIGYKTSRKNDGIYVLDTVLED